MRELTCRLVTGVPHRRSFTVLPVVRGGLFLLLTLVGAGLPPETTLATRSHLIPPTSGVHFALVFNSTLHAPNHCAQEESDVDYVWGAVGLNDTPLRTHDLPSCRPSVWHEYYIPWPRDPNRWQTHTLAWFQMHHPDWLMYRSRAGGQKESNLAWFMDDHRDTQSVVTLDYSNPAVQKWLIRKYLLPAVRGGYEGFSLDDGVGYNGTMAQGHFDRRGKWVQQYNGTQDNDLRYALAQQKALKHIRDLVRRVNPAATFSVNQGYTCHENESYWPLTHANADMVFDESGFTSGGQQNPYFTTAPFAECVHNPWLSKMLALRDLQTRDGKALLLANQEPYRVFDNMTANSSQARFDLQWSLANYLMVKYGHTYFWWGGEQQYGYPTFVQPEYRTVETIGSPVDGFFAHQHVYMRDYSGGLTVVNPAQSESHTIKLPAGRYQDLYGGPVGTYTMPPHSGLVLLYRPGAPHRRIHRKCAAGHCQRTTRKHG